MIITKQPDIIIPRKEMSGIENPQLSGRISQLSGETVSGVSEALSQEAFENKIEEFKTNYLSNKDNSKELQELLNNPNFVSELNKYIFSKFREISEDSSLNSYNEIYFLIYLLSIRIGEKSFDNGDIYSVENFKQLFDSYINKISSLENLDSPEAYEYLNSFSRLCGVLNLICVLSQNDNFKRESILSLASLIFEKIYCLLEKLEEKGFKNNEIFLNSVNYILGLLPLNFSYIFYIKFDKNKENGLNNFLLSYQNIISNTIDGYEVCEKSNFGNDMNREKSIKRVTFINLTHIISLIILKLDGEVNESELLQNEHFKSIVREYLEFIFKYSPNERLEYSSVNDLRKICSIVFIKNYEGFPANTIDFSKTSEEIVSEFLKRILDNPTDDVENLEIIHNLILSNKELPENILFDICNLYLKESSKNINFEAIKLKIFNLILTRLVKSNNGNLKNLLKNLTDYIDKNKVSSELLFVYSLMYISIGYCYSFFDDEDSQELAIENYIKFKQIIYGDFDFKRYGIDIKKFYLNIGKAEEKLSGNSNLTEENYSNTGKRTLEKSVKTYKKQRNSILLGNLDNFISDQKEKDLDLALLSSQLSKLLSSLFYGIAEIEVLDIYSFKEKNISSKHNTQQFISLFNGYGVKVTYPNTFAKDFEKLYREFAEVPETTKTEEIFKNYPEGVIGIVFEKLKAFIIASNEVNKNEIELTNDFEEAFNEGRIDLVFQPIRNSNGNIVKYEILSRIKNPIKKENGTQYNIREYIDAIIKLDRLYLLNRLIEFTINISKDLINESGGSLNLSINLEYINLIDEEVISLLESISTDISSKITIELIEEGKWENEELAIANIIRLKKAGFKIALDDYGTGESSHVRLKNLLRRKLLNYVKIDGKIITYLLSEDGKDIATAKEMILSTIKICGIRGVKVIVEYVSDTRLFNILTELGKNKQDTESQELSIDFFQGYYDNGHPISEEELTRKLEKNK
ncbi:MAG: EAL domain-containing protein [Candidatus Gracilibacteria bacterium]|nr:EAL domain-containing protein [Candidatus Gracilibacteria bacterium]